MHYLIEYFYLAMTVLNMRDELNIPELLAVIDPLQMLKLIDVFGGRYIRVPTREELDKAFSVILYHHHIVINGGNEVEIRKYFDYMSNYEWRHVRQRALQFDIEIKKGNFVIPLMYQKSLIMKELLEWTKKHQSYLSNTNSYHSRKLLKTKRTK